MDLLIRLGTLERIHGLATGANIGTPFWGPALG